MNTFRFKMRAAGITTLLVLVTLAQTSAEEKANRTQTAVEEKPATYFELYCGNCSRSMRYQATFRSLDEVSVAARIAGKEWNRTAIQSTDLTDGKRGKYTKSQTVNYRVFVGFQRRCSVRWDLRSEHPTPREADEVVKALRESNSDLLQIVTHYSQDLESLAKK
ncbi:MAG: hypothetical protein OSA98_25235 [Rubripirellula sp.]|nr:hypothetical protein [Rubripirellula sp.]